VGPRLGLFQAQLAAAPVHPFGGLQISGVEADARGFVGHFPLLVEGILGIGLLAGLPIRDHQLLVLDGVGTVAFEGVRHGQSPLGRRSSRGIRSRLDEALEDGARFGVATFAVQPGGFPQAIGPGAASLLGLQARRPGSKRRDPHTRAQAQGSFHDCAFHDWTPFDDGPATTRCQITAPASRMARCDRTQADREPPPGTAAPGSGL